MARSEPPIFAELVRELQSRSCEKQSMMTGCPSREQVAAHCPKPKAVVQPLGQRHDGSRSRGVDQSYARHLMLGSASRPASRDGFEQIPGAKGLLPSRKYGTPVNFKAIQENLTLATLISRSDAALAHYCGLDASVKHRIDEQREAQKMRAEALRMETEKLAARNQQARQDREVRLGLAPWQRGYRSF